MRARKHNPTQKRDDRLKALETAFDNLPVGVGLFHLDGRPVYMNEPFKALYHVNQMSVSRKTTFEDLIESGAFDDWKSSPQEHFVRVRDSLSRGKAYEADVEIGDRVLSVHDKPLVGGLFLSTQQDITKRVNAEREVAHLANHDALTGLLNRGAFTQHLAETIAAAKQHSRKFAILSVDVDHFKDINDIFGHAAGDALLQEMARRFELCAGGNFLARLGGDEFSFIVSRGRVPQAAGVLANRLLEKAVQEIVHEGQEFMVSLSVGVAVYPNDGLNATTLLSSADAALYRAKADGRGVVRSFEPEMDKQIHEQRQMQQDLKLAIARREFHLLYQPQARTTKDVYGFEALLRWQHPRRGTVAPDRFIPIAEESGLIVEIGEWALREACREAASWERPLAVAVNVSPVQFRHGDLAELVHIVLLETGLAANRLEIEITEGVLVQDFARALSQLRKLKGLGVRIAMDDFGTGHSSLSYLQAFPFDTLKIDKSFISKLGTGTNAEEIVRAVIGLGRGLNLPIVAEGVETDEQLEFLAAERCQSVQGYLVGHPNPIDVYAEIISTTSKMLPLRGSVS